MRYFLYLSVFSVALFSCNQESEVVHLRTVKGQKKEVAKVDANRMLTIEIEGMSCEMACGGSIRTNLKATGAVDRVQYDFEDGRTIQTAFISYDDRKITDKEMVKIIETINEKQFTTHKHSSEAISKESKTSDSENERAEEESKVAVSEVSPSIELPNLFDLLKNLVQ